MNQPDWKKILQASLADWRLTRGEKAVLKHAIEPLRGDIHALSLVRSTAFDLARESLAETESPTEVIDWIEDVVRVIESKTEGSQGRFEAWFSPHPECVVRLNRLFDQARSQVDICVFTITDDRVASAILDAHRRGVKIRLVTDDDKALDAGSDVYRLRREGIEMRTDAEPDHMHHKYAIFDQKTLLTGSYNWTRAASRSNEDNFIITDQPELLRRFVAHFESIWEQYG